MIIFDKKRAMSKFYHCAFCAILLSSTLACGMIGSPLQTPSATIPPSDTVSFTATTKASDTPVATETITPSDTPAATDTSAATISPFLTNIPGIAKTLTAVYSTPGVENTQIAQQTMAAATMGSQLNGFSSNLLSQCPNPSDPPMQSWLDIPVMPQATAGQVVQTLIGSYYCFRAPVTVEEADAFYREKLSAPNWVMQADANGSMEFVGLSQAGMQILFLVYGPGNKNDLLVAINVTRPMSFPTPKP
jgi:hypothetical protein